METSIDNSAYIKGKGQKLSRLGTVIALEKGPDEDEFFLSFEILGEHENAIVIAEPSEPPRPADEDPVSDIGLRTFDEINVSMSAMTGVAKTNPGIAATFNTVKQQLPTLEIIDGFLSSHQMAITQMAIQYCDALVEDTSLSATFFTGFNFSASAETAFDTSGRNLIIDPLLSKLVGNNLNSQPGESDIRTELNSLIDTLTSCGSSCASDRSKTVVKATCAAVLGSAVMLVQ